jgi:hypothetical protein
MSVASAGGLAHSAERQVVAWVPPVARLGYAAVGMVYCLIGFIALRAGQGAGTPEGALGALEALLRDGGRWLLPAVAMGLFAHAAWFLVQAALDPEAPTARSRTAVRVFFAIGAVAHATVAVGALRLFEGRASAGSQDGEERLAGVLLAQPLGRWLLALVGLGVIGYGLQQLLVAWRGDFAGRLWIRHPSLRRAVVAMGRIGTAARGLVFLILGSFFIDAARTFDAQAAGGTGEALRWLGQGWLLGIVAAGLVAYGLLQLANAIFRRIC